MKIRHWTINGADQKTVDLFTARLEKSLSEGGDIDVVTNEGYTVKIYEVNKVRKYKFLSIELGFFCFGALLIILHDLVIHQGF